MLSTAQNVQPGATDRNCPDGVALCAISLRMVRTVWLGTRVEEVRAVHGEAVERALLVDRRVSRKAGNAPALGRPRADEIVVHRDDLAVAVETGRDLLVGQRTREVHRHVVLARIDRP